MKALRILLSAWMLLALSGTRPAPAQGACPIVDRGSPTDGQTTMALIFPPAPCPPDAFWTGWMCAGVRSTANSNGANYLIEMRWNRDGLPCTGTVVWLQASGKTYHRENTTYAQAVQDELDVVDGIRTVEIALIANAFQTAPRNGFPNISAVCADLLEYLVFRGVTEGPVVFFGNSAGAILGANALAYHQFEQLVDGVVLGGGPYWADLSLTCSDPNWATSSVRSDVDTWNWLEWNGSTPCATFSPTAAPPYACRSTLGEEADTVYDGTAVSVIIGKTDPFLPWIDAAASLYYQSITAGTKSYDRPNNCGHTLMNFQSGASKAQQRIREIVASAGGPVDAGDPLPPGPAMMVVSPSPFEATTRVAFTMRRAGPAVVSVHDAAGRRVAVLADSERAEGRHSVLWSGRDGSGRPVPAGVYFLRLQTKGLAQTRKVVRLR